MTLPHFFMLWQDFGLFLYSVLKAFLPLPSLEVVLVPLVIAHPERWLLYAVEGALGTFIGGGIGYVIALRLGKSVLKNIATKEDIQKGEAMMNRYGVWAVFIGGITPIPDFLLAYMAGFTHMRFSLFAFCDAIARFLRSLFVCYGVIKLGEVIPIEGFGTAFSLIILGWLLLRWGCAKWRIHRQNAEESRG